MYVLTAYSSQRMHQKPNISFASSSQIRCLVLTCQCINVKNHTSKSNSTTGTFSDICLWSFSVVKGSLMSNPLKKCVPESNWQQQMKKIPDTVPIMSLMVMKLKIIVWVISQAAMRLTAHHLGATKNVTLLIAFCTFHIFTFQIRHPDMNLWVLHSYPNRS